GNLRKPMYIDAIAIHAENAFGHNKALPSCALTRLQQRFEMVQVVVPKPYLLDACGGAPLVQAGMNELVGKYLRACPTLIRQLQQGWQHRSISLPARREQ